MNRQLLFAGGGALLGALLVKRPTTTRLIAMGAGAAAGWYLAAMLQKRVVLTANEIANTIGAQKQIGTLLSRERLIGMNPVKVKLGSGMGSMPEMSDIDEYDPYSDAMGPVYDIDYEVR